MADFNGFHHFYIGLLLILIGFIILISGKKTKKRYIIASTICSIGAFIAGDDFAQHLIQYTHPEYRSLLNKAYGATLYKIDFIRELNKWFDKLFGGK